MGSMKLRINNLSISNIVKLLVISVGVVLWLGVWMKMKECHHVLPAVPLLALNRIIIPGILVSCLKPPYLYIFLNFIIFSVAASSRFHLHRAPPLPDHQVLITSSHDLDDHQLFIFAKTPADFASDQPERMGKVLLLEEPMTAPDPAPAPTPAQGEVVDHDQLKSVTDVEINDGNDQAAIVVVEEESNLQNMTALDNQQLYEDTDYVYVGDKPLVSSRFSHQKLIRSTTPAQGHNVKALKVAGPKHQETVGSTWKKITEGRHVPLSNHHKIIHASSKLEKQNSFDPPPAYKIRKEPSLGQDELNRRVEAFIKKFNQDLWLQRQESLKRYAVMLSHSA